MSLKWTNSDSGILRKSEFKEKKEELFVFGYSCKLFREDDKALHIDQGKHLIPWMGDETLKIDRYDARGALHDLAGHEAPPGGFDWRVELTKTELEVEQLCDEERYRALYTDEDEEEMYREEELKRLHAAGYGQVGFNYDTPSQQEQTQQSLETDEPFVPTPAFKALFATETIVFPESDKQNVIIEKTAKFIAAQGAQMEILIKAKQGDNPQFKFLNRDNTLHPYYTALINLIKVGKWPEKKPDIVEEKPHENEDYLHPSLASTIIESAPSIPSIHYKPSADCDYTMLISKMRGEAPPEEPYTTELAPGEVAPPGTEPLPPRRNAEISRAPVLYNRGHDTSQSQGQQPPYTQADYQQYLAYYQQYQVQAQPTPTPTPAAKPQKTETKPVSLKSTGLSLMKNYNTDSDSDVSDCDDTSSTDSKEKIIIITPPEEVQTVIDKMADYVSRNGAEFADIVRAKGDPRFAFLEPANEHHAYYCARLDQIRRGDTRQPKKRTAPVSFSIKKLKEPDPILPKPALPYESSSDEEGKDQQNKSDKEENKNSSPLVNKSPFPTLNNIPQTVIYKMDGQHENNLPVVKAIETTKPKTVVAHVIAQPKLYKDETKSEDPKPIPKVEEPLIQEAKKPPTTDVKDKTRKDSPRVRKKDKVERTKHKAKVVEKRKSPVEKQSPEKEKKKEDGVQDMKAKADDLESEIISLEDNSDEVMIDLTEDLSDSKDGAGGEAGAGGGGDSESARAKQIARRRRAAEFLKRVGVDPAAASALPNSSLASAMVDTLESLRKKRAEAEEKRRKREKRRHREKYGYDEGDKPHRKSKRRKYKSSDDEDSEYDGSKKKKRKKDKKSSKSKKKKRRDGPEVEKEKIDHPLPPNIDLTNTLKELRTASPTKDLVLQEVEEVQVVSKDSSSEDEVEVKTRTNKKKKKKKNDREYSEGEWSCDSEKDSVSSHSKDAE